MHEPKLLEAFFSVTLAENVAVLDVGCQNAKEIGHSPLTKAIPEYLKSTHRLLSRAFPEVIRGNEYLPLIGLLYEYMSDRNLAEIVSLFIGRNYETVYNDILLVGGIMFPFRRSL